MPGEPWCKDGRLKIERISINQAQEDTMTYHGRTQIMQPLGNPPKRRYGVIGLIRRCGRIKFEPTNVSRALEVKNTYLPRVNVILLIWRPGKQIRRVSKLTFESRMPGECWRDDGDHG